MKLDSGVIAGIKEVTVRLQARLDGGEDEVIATLRAVATGERSMAEALGDEEQRRARALFGLVATVGPGKIWARVQPLVAAAVTGAGGGAEALHTGALGAGFHWPADLEGIAKLDEHAKMRLAVLLLSYVFDNDFHYPQPETGVYDVAGSVFEKLKWVYRYWFDQLEVAQKDSGLEGFFASQVLDFPPVPLGPGDEVLGRVSLSCAGDLLAVDVLTPENTAHLFDGIADFYSTADIVSANLESTVDETKPIGRHQAPGEAARMNTSQAMFRRFRDDAKINFFSTATNHALDWGEDGVLATLDVLKASGADYAGTAASHAEQDDVVVVERNGIRIGLLSFTFDLNDHPVPDGKPYLVNEVRFNDADPAPDYALVEKHVAAAKAKGAEFIVAYCHWGWEFEMYPHPNITRAAREIVDRGVDVILGNHPHVSQPAQVVPRAGKPDALVTYAFGDFVSYHPESRNSALAYAVRFDIVKTRTGDGTLTALTNLQSLPMYIVNAKRDDGTVDCRIVPFADVLADPDGYGLTERQKAELPHLRDAVWDKILAPLSHIPMHP